MKSVRFDERTAARLREAARLAGVSESAIIRDAVADRTDLILGERLDRQLAEFIGLIDGEGGRAEEAHDRFTRLVKQQRKPGQGRRSRSRP